MTVICGLIPLLGVKIIHLADGTNLFKASNLVWGGKEIVTAVNCSLERERWGGREREVGR